eukprot:scaffold79442_cov66-Phaeocystis_antarctica.AAC.6
MRAICSPRRRQTSPVVPPHAAGSRSNAARSCKPTIGYRVRPTQSSQPSAGKRSREAVETGMPMASATT